MTADKDALLSEGMMKGYINHACLCEAWDGYACDCGLDSYKARITAALAEKDDGWMPMSGKYAGEIWRHHPSLRSPDGRVWPEALETVNVLVQRPRYLEAQIARLWLDAERNIQTSFPCGDAIRWRPLPPLPKGDE